LPQELDNVYQKAKRGVIYMSFGTVAPSYAMPEESKRAFLEAFNELSDITFLWKYEKEDGLTKNYPNVITKAWFPQPNILCELIKCVLILLNF
jgi:UDP:flavonoid glycosyltransferase YjiC (YdhE family)